MALTVPNYDVVHSAGYDALAGPDQRDFDTIVGGLGRTGVLNGCQVTAQSSPNMTVQVASGLVVVQGAALFISAVSSLTISTADATNPRIDVVTVDSTGTVAVHTGTAASAPEAATAAKDSDGQVQKVALAFVYVPAAATTITSGQIIDKRVQPATVLAPRFRYGAGPTVPYEIPGAMPTGMATSTRTAGANYYEPFFLPQRTAYDQFAIEVSTAGTSGTGYRVALAKADSDGQPAASGLILDSGAIDASTTGVKTIASAQTLEPGFYVFVTNHDYTGTTPVLRAWLAAALGGGVIVSTLGANSILGSFRKTTAYGAFPSSIPAFDTVSTAGNANPRAIVGRRSA